MLHHVGVKLLYLLALAVAVYLVGSGLIQKYVRELGSPSSTKSYVLQTYKDQYGDECNVAVVRLENDFLYATDAAQSGASVGFGADVIVSQIEQAKDDDRIK